MHLPNDKEFKKKTVLVPKRMQTVSTSASNHDVNFDNHISLNASLLPNGFTPRKNSWVSPLIRPNYSIAVRAEVHQSSDNIITNGSVIELTDLVKDTNKMTAIKSILKTKKNASQTKCAIKTINLEAVDPQSVSNKFKFEDNINNENRRKSSFVQFDMQNIKDNSKVPLNTTSNVISSTPTISSARLSIGVQSILSNQTNPNDFPKVSQRMSDLRKILNPEIEKEDSLKKLGDAIVHCDCFELNLNNAAKIITGLVLLATLILVIHSLRKDI